MDILPSHSFAREERESLYCFCPVEVVLWLSLYIQWTELSYQCVNFGNSLNTLKAITKYNADPLYALIKLHWTLPIYDISNRKFVYLYILHSHRKFNQRYSSKRLFIYHKNQLYQPKLAPNYFEKKKIPPIFSLKYIASNTKTRYAVR